MSAELFGAAPNIDTWLLTMTEECGLRVFWSWVLRRIFDAKRGEVTGEWGKLHMEDLMCG